MQRRGFLAGILAAGFAPAAVGSGILMPVKKVQLSSWTTQEFPGVMIGNPKAVHLFPDFDPRSLLIRNGQGEVIFFATPDQLLDISEGKGRIADFMKAIDTRISTGGFSQLLQY